MNTTLEQSPLSMLCIPFSRIGVRHRAPDVVLVVIVVLVFLGTPVSDITALLSAASLLIAQAGSNLRRTP
ncbi:hypothetical protein [Streptomyces sp. NPDC057579]|uniref:hypothetical protein n=1 Tax=Streptomyces sp. NPDC057579 TaxID=3346172 RepID=UPI0036A0619E